MCGIVGICHGNGKNQVETALTILENRGKDNRGIIELDGCVLGHNLHAVVGHVKQPLQKEGTIIANCEIYNWVELNEKYELHAQNDAKLVLHFLEKFGLDKIEELDGVFAFAYYKNGKIIVARDLFGVKPLWYTYTTDGFAFASEKKALEGIGYVDVQELNPRHILIYDIATKNLNVQIRDFVAYQPEHTEEYKILKEETEKLLDSAIAKRIPEQKLGLLFSGGIDSTYLAKYLKDNGHEFICYTAVLDTETAVPSDLEAAQNVAAKLGLDLKIKRIKIDEIPDYVKKIVPLIEDSNVVKVGVALTFYLACEMAKRDGCKVILSGLGSEEIFAGYERHKNSANINQECVSGLLKMYERDLYRDDVLTMDNQLELRVPFLDRALVEYALKIPEQYKIKDGKTKYILRDIAVGKGLSKEFAMRKKTAAQYGSRIDNALGKLAKREGVSKSAYLQQFYPSHNVKLGVLFSSGKDSTSAAYIMQKQNYQLTCLITMKSTNPDSYMFQTAGTELVELQAEAMGLPLVVQETKGEKEAELEDLKKAIMRAKEEYGIEGVVSGALFSTYQRDRIEKICDELGLKIFSPLWHKPQEQHMKEVIRNGFTVVLTSIAADGLDASWLGRELTLEDVEKLEKLNEGIGLNIAGEGGEFESLVLDGPLFMKKIELEETKIVEEAEHTARLIITNAKLEEK